MNHKKNIIKTLTHLGDFLGQFSTITKKSNVYNDLF